MTTRDRTQIPEPAPIRPFTFPGVERRELGNGLTILSARHGNLPLVTAELVIRGGASTDPEGRAGLAYLTLRALETGSLERSGDQLARELEYLGVELDTSTTWDALAVRVTAPRERIEPALAILAEIVRSPAFPEPEIERLRDEQFATIMQRRKDPGALASDMAVRFIFRPDVPYARPLIGGAESVGDLDRDSVSQYHRRFFLPNSASLIMVGDIDIESATSLADQFFGDWDRGDAPSTEFEVLPGVEETTIFIIDRPGAVQSEIRIGSVGVARSDPDYFPILIMNSILGGAFTSRLNMSLREKHGFTYGVHSGFAFRRKSGPFAVQTAVGTEVTAPAVREALEVMAGLQRDGATTDEVDANRDYLRGIMPLQLQTTDQLASKAADLVTFELPDDYFDHYRDQIGAVSTEEVRRVAARVLKLQELAIVIVGDAETIAEPLRELGVGPVEVHEIRGAGD